jgi:phosphate/sulfate permease
MRTELRWGVGCLVGSAALTGMLILVLLVAATLQPPAWVQVIVGLALVAGGGLLTWLVVSALGQSRAREEMKPHPVPPPDETP